MNLPEWDTDTDLLPPGRHPTTIDGLYGRLVEDAPHREHRERLFSAFLLHCKLVSDYLPSGASLWVDGGFVMCKDSPPRDVDVAIVPNDWADIAGWTDQQSVDILGLITLQNVIIEHPWPAMVERVQPVGALLDAFLVHKDNTDEWHAVWSSVKLDGMILPDLTKGYAEVQI